MALASAEICDTVIKKFMLIGNTAQAG